MGFRFGEIAAINSVTGTGSIVAIVLFLVLFEYITDFVELLEEATPSTYLMIQKVFKELMIMGLVSFLIVMFETTSYAEKTHSVVLAVDYVHILLFFMALLFILHAFLLIRLSEYLSRQYEQFHFKEISSLLHDIKNTRTAYHAMCFDIECIPGTTLRRGLEFKVLATFFHQSFKLPYDFVFSDYLSGCFEKYALQLLDIGPFTWFSIIVLALINLGRVELLKRVLHNEVCTENGAAQAHRYLSSQEIGIDADCAEYDMQVFMCGAAMLVALVIILVIISRIYEMRMLRKAGVSGVADSIKLLEAEDERVAEIKKLEDIQDLPEDFVVRSRRGTDIQNKNMIDGDRKGSLFIGKLSNRTLKRNIELLLREQNLKERRMRRKALNTVMRSADIFMAMFAETFYCCVRMIRKRNLSTVMSPKIGLSSSRKHLEKIKQQSMMELNRGRAESEIVPIQTTETEKKDVKTEIKLEEDLNSIFLFNSSKLYFRAVEFAIMLNCLYMAFVSTSFWTIASNSHNSSLWHAALIMPLLITFPCLGAIVSTSSKILAISQLKVDIIGKVLQQDEETEKLIADLREKVSYRLNEKYTDEQKREELRAIFDELDVDKNHVIYRNEFWRLLRALNVHYSNAKFNRIFRTIDEDKSGSISMEEFIDLVVPKRDHHGNPMPMRKQSFVIGKQSIVSQPSDGSLLKKSEAGGYTASPAKSRIHPVNDEAAAKYAASLDDEKVGDRRVSNSKHAADMDLESIEDNGPAKSKQNNLKR